MRPGRYYPDRAPVGINLVGAIPVDLELTGHLDYHGTTRTALHDPDAAAFVARRRN